MKIAVILIAHGNTELVLDSLDALRTWVSEDILVVVDGTFWNSWGSKTKLPAYKMAGFPHNTIKAPYRNVAFGLMNAWKLWNNVDWICYTEPDVLFANDGFKDDLKKADQDGVWCLGSNLRNGYFEFPLLEKILDLKFNGSKYLLGSCMFYHKDFMKTLFEKHFFEKFLSYTNDLAPSFFPEYEGYDFSEHLYPTLAHHFGGKVAQLSSWSDFLSDWEAGNFQKYPLRWKPELEAESYLFNACIMHPIKRVDHPFRILNKVKRKNVRIF